MKISIIIDVDAKASGYENDDDLRDNIINFSRNLIINGAEEECIELTLLDVEYEIS